MLGLEGLYFSLNISYSRSKNPISLVMQYPDYRMESCWNTCLGKPFHNKKGNTGTKQQDIMNGLKMT